MHSIIRFHRWCDLWDVRTQMLMTVSIQYSYRIFSKSSVCIQGIGCLPKMSPSCRVCNATWHFVLRDQKEKKRERAKYTLSWIGLERNAAVSVVTTCDVCVEEKGKYVWSECATWRSREWKGRNDAMTDAGRGRGGQLSYNSPPPWPKRLAQHTDAQVDGSQGGRPRGLKNCVWVCLCNEPLRMLSLKSRPWIISRVCVWIRARPSLP